MADEEIPTSSGAAKNLTHALFGHDTDDPREITKNLGLTLFKVGIIALIVVCILYLVFGIRRMINTLRYGGFAVGSGLSAEVGSINPDTLPIMPTQMHSKTLEKLKETVYIEPKKHGSVFMNEPEAGKDSLFQGIRKKQRKDVEKNLSSSHPNNFSKESIGPPKEGEKVEKVKCSMNPIAPQMPITIAKIAHTETKKDVPISKEIKKSEVHQRTNKEVPIETVVQLTTVSQKLLENAKKSNETRNVPINLDQKKSSTIQPKSDDLFLSAKSEEKLQVEAQPKKSSPIKEELVTTLPGLGPIRDETGYVKKLESPISPMRDESESIARVAHAVSPIRDESEFVIDAAKKSITESTEEEFKISINIQNSIKTNAEQTIFSENTGKKKDKISSIRDESEPSKKVVPPVSPMRDASELVTGDIKKTGDKTITESTKEELKTLTGVQNSQTSNAIKTNAEKSIPIDDKKKKRISLIHDESVPTKIIPAENMPEAERKFKVGHEKWLELNSKLLQAKESCERYKLRDTALLSSFLLRESSVSSLVSLSTSDSREPTIERKTTISNMISTKFSPQKNVLLNLQKPATPKTSKQKTSIKPKSAPSRSPETITINGKVYWKFNRRGKGGSSQVYECRSDDLQCQVAVKIVDLDGQHPVIRDGYMNEVKLLQKLQGNETIIKLNDYELREDLLYVVLELGDVDFFTYLNTKKQLKSSSVRHFFRQMLQCVQTIHEHGVVHSDLKPANFLIVKGDLKLIDFGISSEIDPDMTCVVKHHQVGTVNYMSPESFYMPDMAIELRKATDVWSLGCILYLMIFKTPPYGSFKDRKNAIINNRPIDYKNCDDSKLIDLIKKCLTHDYKKRPTVTQLLKHEWLKE